VNISIVTGGFDPLHSGHIAYLKSAAKHGTILVVGLNSDEWLARKKGASFMPFEERKAVLQEMNCVTEVIKFNDSDNSSKDAIIQIRKRFPSATNKIIFCNGGDRTKDNIPEMDVDDPNIEFMFGVGGENKKNSSSWILKQWQYPNEKRVWGEFSNLFQDDVVKVKELIIEPGKGISYQRHFKRDEIWFVSKGSCSIKFGQYTNQPDQYSIVELDCDQIFTVKAGQWHQAYNTTSKPCHIIEIQYGDETNEEDIERLEMYGEG